MWGPAVLPVALACNVSRRIQLGARAALMLVNLITWLMEPNGRVGPHLSLTGPSLPGQGYGQENKNRIKTYTLKLSAESEE